MFHALLNWDGHRRDCILGLVFDEKADLHPAIPIIGDSLPAVRAASNRFTDGLVDNFAQHPRLGIVPGGAGKPMCKQDGV